MKILSPWPWRKGHPRGGDGTDKNFRSISTIMPNMNEIHQRVFKIWGLVNFNAKTLTLWRKDEQRTYERMNIRTNKWTNGKAKTIYPPHTSYVRGIIKQRVITPKIRKPELSILYVTCHSVLIYISTKYHRNIPKGIQVTEKTRSFMLTPTQTGSVPKSICPPPLG